MTTVRPALMDDVEVLTTMVAEAFAADPGWSHMMGAGNREAMRAFAQLLLLPRIRRGTAWVVDDGLALAMWDRRALDLTPDPDRADRWAAFRTRVGARVADRIEAYDVAVSAVAPGAPYWYLGVLATHPDAQGRGLATAALQPGLAAADADGWDCWLETSSEANAAFYAARGFVKERQVDLDGGPMTWWMRRPAD